MLSLAVEHLPATARVPGRTLGVGRRSETRMTAATSPPAPTS
jgi:hypothetical protein